MSRIFSAALVWIPCRPASVTKSPFTKKPSGNSSSVGKLRYILVHALSNSTGTPIGWSRPAARPKGRGRAGKA